jgi:nucleoside-diphosphate-sugar epimerase
MTEIFLMSDVINAISKKTTLNTSTDNLVRDYLHPKDFYQLISKILECPRNNCQIDCYTKAPIEKFTLLKALQERFHLKFKIDTKKVFLHPTGRKIHYYSLSRKASKFNYHPEYSSIEAICMEIELYLKNNI